MHFDRDYRRLLEKYYPQKRNEEPWYIWIALITLILGALLILTSCAQAESKEDTIASVISAEACSEGKQGMYLVANTIANRAKLHKTAPYLIVTAKNQYYGLTNPNRLKIYHSEACFDYSNYLADNIMNLKDKTNGAIFFLLPNEHQRSWHKQLTVTYKKHRFYK